MIMKSMMHRRSLNNFNALNVHEVLLKTIREVSYD